MLAVLGILVVLSCITLFTPFKYQGEVWCPGDWHSIRGTVKFSWLCSLIRGNITYQDEVFSWKVRIAGKKITSESTEEPAATHTLENTGSMEKTEVVKEAKTPKSAEIPYEKVKQFEREPQKIKQKKIKSFFNKLQYTFQKICDTIKSLLRKKDILMEFLRSEIHQAAFWKSLKELKRLLYFLRPQQCKADIEFGFSDPCLTGQVLAGLSILYPFLGEYTEIQPNFDEKVLKGNLFIKGKACSLYFVILLWNLIWDKNVRTTFSHIRKMHL